MPKANSNWLPLYIGVALFGSVGGYLLSIEGPTVAPPEFLVLVGLITFVFSAVTAFWNLWNQLSLQKDRAVLDACLWTSSPIKPQSNRFAQIVFFGAIGLVALTTARCPISQSIGFFPLAMAVGIAVGLLFFRHAYRRKLLDSQR